MLIVMLCGVLVWVQSFGRLILDIHPWVDADCTVQYNTYNIILLKKFLFVAICPHEHRSMSSTPSSFLCWLDDFLMIQRGSFVPPSYNLTPQSRFHRLFSSHVRHFLPRPLDPSQWPQLLCHLHDQRAIIKWSREMETLRVLSWIHSVLTPRGLLFGSFPSPR